MKFLKNNKMLAVIVSIFLVIIVIFSILLVILLSKDDSKDENTNQSEQEQSHNQNLPPVQPQPNLQESSADFKFQRLPFDVQDIGSVAPIGEFAGINRSNVQNSHFYGNMRHYVFSKFPGQRAYNVYVPADGEITGFRNNEMTGEFRFNFRIDGNTFYYLDHIQSLTEETKALLEPYFGNPIRFTQAVEQVNPGIPVKAGDVLGQTGLKGIAWDWGMIDQAACEDILFPEHYKQDQCPKSVYDHLPDDLKALIDPLAGYWTGSSLTKVNKLPVLGKYAHDVEGTLSGGWFFDYTNQPYSNTFFNPDSYEDNMLQIRLAVSELSLLGVWQKIPIGTDINPDPKLVTPEDGIVAYTLSSAYKRDTEEFGILLARVNTDGTITLEALANQTSAPVNPSFSNNAITLTR